MTEVRTIKKRSADRGQRQGGKRRPLAWSVLLRSVLAETGLLRRVVRSLSVKLGHAARYQVSRFLSFLFSPFRPMMLAGLRCAGAGGGGPGH
ncbi:MAG: hypothetical protein ACRBM6_20960 [Geminicoccales bacterium]